MITCFLFLDSFLYKIDAGISYDIWYIQQFAIQLNSMAYPYSGRWTSEGAGMLLPRNKLHFGGV